MHFLCGMFCVACSVWYVLCGKSCVASSVWHVLCGMFCVVCTVWHVLCGMYSVAYSVWYACLTAGISEIVNNIWKRAPRTVHLPFEAELLSELPSEEALQMPIRTITLTSGRNSVAM